MGNAGFEGGEGDTKRRVMDMAPWLPYRVCTNWYRMVLDSETETQGRRPTAVRQSYRPMLAMVLGDPGRTAAPPSSL